MNGKKIVVLGGGFGGVAAARVARSLLGTEHEVTLIDRNRRTYLCASFPEFLITEGTAASRSIGVLANRGIRFVEEQVESIDLASKAVTTPGVKIDYDYLVIALGSEYHWGAVKGSRSSQSFYDIHAARNLRRRLNSFRKGRILVAVCSLPYKCPPAPYEVAMILEQGFRNRAVRRDIDLHVSTPEPTPLGITGPESSNRFVRVMDRKGINIHTSKVVSEISTDTKQVSFTDGDTMEIDMTIIIPPHRVPKLVSESGLAGPSGWIEVSQLRLETHHPDVYAVGDVNIVPMSNGFPLPKSGVFASSEGETVGKSISASILGMEPPVFSGAGQCFIGYGDQRAGVVKGNFFAPGKPDVRLLPATERGFRAKQRFQRDWKRFRI